MDAVPVVPKDDAITYRAGGTGSGTAGSTTTDIGFFYLMEAKYFKEGSLTGRSRLNCTVKDKNNNWRWFGSQFYY